MRRRRRRFDARDGRGTLRAGRTARGILRALLATLRIAAATGLACPRCDRMRA